MSSRSWPSAAMSITALNRCRELCGERPPDGLAILLGTFGRPGRTCTARPIGARTRCVCALAVLRVRQRAHRRTLLAGPGDSVRQTAIALGRSPSRSPVLVLGAPDILRAAGECAAFRKRQLGGRFGDARRFIPRSPHEQWHLPPQMPTPKCPPVEYKHRGNGARH